MPRFSLPKLRSSRERSVDSRKTTASQSSSRAKSNKVKSRSVSVPPQQRRIVNTSTSSVTASSNSRSATTTKTATRSSNLRAAGTSYETSDGAVATNNSKASYTFAQDQLPPTNERQMSYESDANISTASTTDEFITSLDRSPPKLEDMFLEAGAFGRSNSKASSSAQNGINNNMEYDDPPDIIPSLEEDEPNDCTHHHHDANQNDMFSVDTELTEHSSFKHFSEQCQWTAFDSNK